MAKMKGMFAVVIGLAVGSLATGALTAALAQQGSAAASQIGPPASRAEAERLFRRADADLNALWQRCTAPEAGTVQSIAALRQSQQAWVAVRDQTARAYQLANSDRRPLDDEYYAQGRMAMTLSRISELRTLFGCE
jgi:uncharacterized protein YecT (DUF1311 family)